MKVEYKQFEFETDAMEAFPTGQMTIPAIFVNENGLCFALTNRTTWDQPKIRHLNRYEAARLAQAYRLYELTERLQSVQRRRAQLTA